MNPKTESVIYWGIVVVGGALCGTIIPAPWGFIVSFVFGLWMGTTFYDKLWSPWN